MIDMDLARATHLKLRGKKTAIVFRHDDGWIHTYDFLPVYADHGVNASWFITTDFIGNVTFESAQWPGGVDHLDNAQLLELYAAGHEIGSHSMSHPRFDILTADQRRAEMLGSAEALEAIIGGSYICDTWAYPGNVVVPAEAHEIYLAGTGDNTTVPETLIGAVDIHNFGACYAEATLIDHASLAATTTKTTAQLALWKAARSIAIVQTHGLPECTAAELDAMLDVLAADADTVILTFRELVHWIRATWHTNDGRNYRPARPRSIRTSDPGTGTTGLPEAPARVGDVAYVNGAAKVCIVAGTPGTWRSIGNRG